MQTLIMVRVGDTNLQFDGDGYQVDDEGVRTEAVPSLLGKYVNPPDYPEKEFKDFSAQGAIVEASQVVAHFFKQMEEWNQKRPAIATSKVLRMLIGNYLNMVDTEAIRVRQGVTDAGIHIRACVARTVEEDKNDNTDS